jgi:hypothetical protein
MPVSTKVSAPSVVVCRGGLWPRSRFNGGVAVRFSHELHHGDGGRLYAAVVRAVRTALIVAGQ